ncbi:Cys/Met metabolism PLP-dependent enzyme-domain-containing protein [Chytriomyces sp. MP71]|nr:Cys/Met metabolism PLP-dependent enzyme-domain-containing protein [Chytriomyces sp. MP71]
MGQFDYTRSGNPTRTALEVHLAKLMRCDRAFAVSTGMSALDAVLRLARTGDEIVAGDDLYGGTNRLLTHMKDYLAITVHHVDTTDNDAVRAVLHPTKTKFVLLESPTNPCIKICDIRAISEMVRSVCSPETLVVVDNTMMSPLLMNCFELGADIEYHSGTKFLSGHHDLMAGVIGVKCYHHTKRIYIVINSIGSGLAPFDCFLLLRGIKTLALRVERQQSNAEKIARAVQDLGFRVRYPGLESHPQRALHMSMAKGGGAVMSFATGDVHKSVRIVEACRLWGISVSFGCVNSLISMPCHMSHASIPAHVRKERGLSDDLIRLCVGIEDVEDLIDDLKAAICSATVESAIKGGDR